LFNRGNASVDLSGWSVQYASAGGASWQLTNLSGVLQPGHYYLVQEAAGSGGTTNLPTPDATGNINMSASAGKVALVNATTALGGSGCPFGATVVDFVAYGSEKSCFEGAAAAPAPSNTNAVQRADGGCTDTDNNSADFATGSPNPRNSNSPAHLCAGAGAQTNAGVGHFQIEFGSSQTEIGGSQTETGVELFASEEPLPLLLIAYSFEDFSARRPRADSTRWRRVAAAFYRRGTRGVRPRPRGAWP
jgi:predicted extracellular nuclease